MAITYDHRELLQALPWTDIFPPLDAASETIARFDERMDRNDGVAASVASRIHFREACSTLWLEGYLVRLEDLVLHDASSDLGAPTPELFAAAEVLRIRHALCRHPPEWPMSEAGLLALIRGSPVETAEVEVPDHCHEVSPHHEEDRLLRSPPKPTSDGRTLPAAPCSDLTNEHCSEEERVQQWLTTIRATEDLPAVLAAAFAWDAWATTKPLQGRDLLEIQLVAALFRYRGKTKFHLPALNVGMRAAGYRRSGHDDLPVRLCAFFRAVKAAAEMGLRDLSEVSRAKQRMEERVGGRRRNSRLPELIQLFLYSPVVTVPLAAKSLRVSPQAVEGMIKTLGPGLLRELTGRARNRVWSIR
jgi:Protein of unknown function (DUF1612)/HTH DNA binding domain